MHLMVTRKATRPNDPNVHDFRVVVDIDGYLVQQMTDNGLALLAHVVCSFFGGIGNANVPVR